MQTRLQDFNSFSIGLLADLEMNEQQQNKVLSLRPLGLKGQPVGWKCIYCHSACVSHPITT